MVNFSFHPTCSTKYRIKAFIVIFVVVITKILRYLLWLILKSLLRNYHPLKNSEVAVFRLPPSTRHWLELKVIQTKKHRKTSNSTINYYSNNNIIIKNKWKWNYKHPSTNVERRYYRYYFLIIYLTYVDEIRAGAKQIWG